VSQLAYKLLGAAHVEDEGRGVLGPPCVDLVRGHPPRAVPVADEGGQEGDCRQQGQGQEPGAHQGRPPADSLAPGSAEIRIRQGPRRHSNPGRHRKGADREAGEPQGIVEEIKGEHRDKPYKGHKAPAFALDPSLDLLQALPQPMLDPVRRQVAGEEKRRRGPRCGPRQAQQRPGQRAKERPTGQREHRPRDK
jgi:hypothetical protein